MGKGRPSKYKDEYNRIAYQMALLGATDKELAKAFDTTEQTINNWKNDYPDFFESLKKGKLIADGHVADKLYQRATGYEHEDCYISNYQGLITITPIIKHYPPDTTAAIFWLKNRQPDKWKDIKAVDHTTKGDSMKPLNIIVDSPESAKELKSLLDAQNNSDIKEE